MNTVAPDLLGQINNAVIDLQNADYQTYARPLKVLGRLLKHPELRDINKNLKSHLDLDDFLNKGTNTGDSFVGSKRLDWPEDPREIIGLSLMLVSDLQKNLNS